MEHTTIFDVELKIIIEGKVDLLIDFTVNPTVTIHRIVVETKHECIGLSEGGIIDTFSENDLEQLKKLCYKNFKNQAR